MGTALDITLQRGKKTDGHGSTEVRFYFNFGVVWELSTFGVWCWQVGALLEKVLGKKCPWRPCPVVVSCSGHVQPAPSAARWRPGAGEGCVPCYDSVASRTSLVWLCGCSV